MASLLKMLLTYKKLTHPPTKKYITIKMPPKNYAIFVEHGTCILAHYPGWLKPYEKSDCIFH